MNLYGLIRTFLSHEAKGRLTRFLYLTGLKPRINRKAASQFRKGIVVLSADFEMAWAFRYSKSRNTEAVTAGLQERNNIPVLLDLFEVHNIPVTWATVGHLFLRECGCDPGRPAHREMPRPPYFTNKNWAFSSGDWYDHDPCTDVNSDPAWYASDLVDKIMRSPVRHEFGCHTFSHCDFTYANCSRELADAELDASVKAASARNISLRSMVFPGGTFGNFESLAEKGFICYRKPMECHIDICHTDQFGLTVIPSSLGLGRDPYGWSAQFHLKIIDRFLKAAARHKLVCHFWFHPSVDKWYLDNVMPGLLSMIASYRDRGLIATMTMEELAVEYRRSQG